MLSQDQVRELAEEIEEVFSEHGECDHDVEGPSSDYGGHHFISFSLGKQGTEKIRKILEGLK